MNRVVFKYPLRADSIQVVELPEGFEILHIDFQMTHNEGEVLYLWALVDNTAPLVKRRVLIRGTGAVMPANHIQHIGTVVGSVSDVWHVFVILDES